MKTKSLFLLTLTAVKRRHRSPAHYRFLHQWHDLVAHWSSTPSRLYTIETTTDLLNPASLGAEYGFQGRIRPRSRRHDHESPLTEPAGATGFGA